MAADLRAAALQVSCRPGSSETHNQTPPSWKSLAAAQAAQKRFDDRVVVNLELAAAQAAQKDLREHLFAQLAVCRT